MSAHVEVSQDSGPERHSARQPATPRRRRNRSPQQLRLFRPLHPSPHQREIGLEFIGRLRRTLAEAQPAG